MSVLLLDTSVLIPLRDRDDKIIAKLALLNGPILVSIISVVELVGGVERDRVMAIPRRLSLENLLKGVQVLNYEMAEARAYGQIVAVAGYSRRKILDRMIAAQALVAGATLVTLNHDDFTDIPNLKVHTL
jgi:tRNA(fMet)-specific endonuclease VapC